MVKEILGIDAGGSHVAAGWFNASGLLKDTVVSVPLDTTAAPNAILAQISSLISTAAGSAKGIRVGMAMPGPFLYKQGICCISGVGSKFSKAFGLDFRTGIKNGCGGDVVNDIVFSNDAHCFAAGAHRNYAQAHRNALFITLGTGLGSTFILDGKIADQHPALPPGGMLYNEPFEGGKADDHFSTRWFIDRFLEKSGRAIHSVKELAELAGDDELARSVFSEFGYQLAGFLVPWMRNTACSSLVIGGNIALAWPLFKNSFYLSLNEHDFTIEVELCNNTEEMIMTGAALLAKDKTDLPHDNDPFRKSSQPLLPLNKVASEGYELYPSFPISGGIIHAGFRSLAKSIATENTLVIDGYGGVFWNQFRVSLNHALLEEGIKPLWFSIDACLKDEGNVDQMIAASLNGDDPVFGKRYAGSLSDFFDSDKLRLIQPDPSSMSIVFGTGASLVNWSGMILYLDVPKNEIQYRMRAGSITNLGSSLPGEKGQMYKRCYFVDWPILNKHKKQLLPLIDILIDEQRVEEITWISGDHLRGSLDKILQHAFRARPWFEAGVWGGQWLKNKLKTLNQEELNYAWSFELISPENGVVLSSNDLLLEISFDLLLFRNNQLLLGKAAERFGDAFPIRFDFLDTFDGGNLSIQCHPRPRYIKEKFGEDFTQDETYYMLDAGPEAEVFLGFQDNIDPSAFRSALEEARTTGKEMDVQKYVRAFPAKKHHLFLIPNGTIHAAGKNNLVLEISATPYIFTFKMYDWQRLDLNGSPRPINIEHAFANLYFDRKGDYVEQHLISKPGLMEESQHHQRWKLPTHLEHFYDIERWEFTGEIQIETKGQCHIGMLVEGLEIQIKTGEFVQTFRFAETFVVPAAAERYIVKHHNNGMAIIVIAYVRDQI